MTFKIEEKIFEKFPELNIGLVVAKGIDNGGESQESPKTAILDKAISKHRLKWIKESPVEDGPRLDK